MVALIFVPFTHVHSPSNRVKCAGNLKQIFTALQVYYIDTDNRYPPSLSCLYPKYINDLRLFQCPSVGAPQMTRNFDEQRCDYGYICYPDDSVRKFDAGRIVLVFEKGINHSMDCMFVLYMDGQVVLTLKRVLVAELQELANNERLSVPTRDLVRKTLAEVLAEGSVKRESR